jgi:hypothetical protein
MHPLATYRKCLSRLERPSRIAGNGNGKEVKKCKRRDAGQACSRRITHKMSPLPFGVVTTMYTD